MLSSTKSLVMSAACVLFGLALQTPTAFAGLNDDPPSIKVSYSGLDLSSPNGAATLYQRIKHAAHVVCTASARDMGPLRPNSGQRQCEEKAVGNAVRDVDQPLVSALWQTQTRLAFNR